MPDIRVRWICLPVLSLLLAACGGGGSGDAQSGQNTVNPPAIQTPPPDGDNAGTSPPPGPLTDIRFAGLSDIAADANGNIYVTDSAGGQGSVRRISPDGSITTLVEYEDKFVSKIAVMPDGDVFYSTSEASDSHPSGMLQTIWRLADGGPAEALSADIGILNAMTVDPDNADIYIADGRQVKRIGQDGSVATLFQFDMGYAGSMAIHEGVLWMGRHDSPRSGQLFRLGADDQPELVASEPSLITSMASGAAGLYFARSSYVIANDPVVGCIIELFNPDTLAATPVAGNPAEACGYRDGTGQSAGFETPIRIARAADGNLYVADRENQVIRRVTPDGNVSLFAGEAPTTGGS